VSHPDSIYISTAALPPLDMQSRLESMRAIGIDRIELGANLRCVADEVEPACRRAAGCAFLIHNYFPPPPEPFLLNLAADDGAQRARSLAFCKRAVDLAASIGAPFYSVHAGFRAALDPASLGKVLQYDEAVPFERAYSTFVSQIRELITYAQSKHVAILIEPNVVAPFNLRNGRNDFALLATAEEFERLSSDLADMHFGILLDTGHLNVTASTLGFDREEFVECVAAQVAAFHVHDNDGTADQHRPVRAGSWVIDVLRQRPFRTLPIVVESKFGTVDEARAHRDWLAAQLD
jgi:sugar phosphate isomerase/epimerase